MVNHCSENDQKIGVAYNQKSGFKSMCQLGSRIAGFWPRSHHVQLPHAKVYVAYSCGPWGSSLWRGGGFPSSGIDPAKSWGLEDYKIHQNVLSKESKIHQNPLDPSKSRDPQLLPAKPRSLAGRCQAGPGSRRKRAGRRRRWRNKTSYGDLTHDSSWNYNQPEPTRWYLALKFPILFLRIWQWWDFEVSTFQTNRHGFAWDSTRQTNTSWHTEKAHSW